MVGKVPVVARQVLKELGISRTPNRRRWQTGIAAITATLAPHKRLGERPKP